MKKIVIIILKIVSTCILTYSLFMTLFMSIFDSLSLSISTDLTTFWIEKIIPNACAIIAIFLLIRRIWTSCKRKSNIHSKCSKDIDNCV